MLSIAAGETGAALLTGEKNMTQSNIGLAVQDFVLNYVPFSMSVNSAGEGSTMGLENKQKEEKKDDRNLPKK